MPWVALTAVFLPPLRGSDVNIVFTVGYEHAFGVHFTHGWVPASLRDSCGLHPRLGAFSRHAAVIAPSGRHDRGWSYRQLRSRSSLAGGYDCVALRANDATAGRRRHTVTPFGRKCRGLHSRQCSCHRYAVLMLISYLPWVTSTPLASTSPTAGFPHRYAIHVGCTHGWGPFPATRL